MGNQIEKARPNIETPSKGKKVKFFKTIGEHAVLNQALIGNSKILLVIKRYYTYLDENIASNQNIIELYNELYRVKKTFRISKHDLQTRPIFYFKQEAINLHLLICFMALAASKHIELTTVGSIRRFLSKCKKVANARMLNKITNQETRLRSKYIGKNFEIHHIPEFAAPKRTNQETD